jgi:hypothetical protein
MKKMQSIVFIILGIGWMLMPPQLTTAEMSSVNYRITTSVISSGGSTMGSANFKAKSTVGQSSPLQNPTDPPYSDSYDLYPGFWYVAANIGSFCPGDDDFDKDIDGLDLAAYILDSGGINLSDFAMNFGKAICP